MTMETYITNRGLTAWSLAAALCILAPQTLPGQTTVPDRQITFNGRVLTTEQMQKLEVVERYVLGARLHDGNYWYDNRSGAVGFWNGPGMAQFPAGLGLGGIMPANCSGGATRVFVNGRALHPLDVAALSRLGPVMPGRYWVDANGDFGFENGPRMGNLFALARQANRPAQRCITCGMYSPGDMIVNPGGATDTSTGNSAYPR
jgi:hypothetical protein